MLVGSSSIIVTAVIERVAATIVSNNYIAQARVFARSFLRHNPGARVQVAIVDMPDDRIDYGHEPFETVFASELGIPNFHHFAFKYSILELNTAVKPSFLRHLHRTIGCRSLCYFDPDILVTADLAPLYEKLNSYRLILTPHITQPMDGDRPAIPSERDLLSAGVFNLGFLGISFDEESLRFLDWWSRKVYCECLSRPDLGLFVDQKWMDLAPAFLSNTAVLREAGYNVAYWNLMQQQLARKGDDWFAGHERLRFFHFSGYDPDNPKELSKYQDRIQLSDRPDVQPLFDLYRSLLEQEDHSSLRKIRYQYSAFDNGAVIPLPARQILQSVDADGRRWSNPFKTEGPDSFFSWLQTPVIGSSACQVTRLALALWDHRRDLQTAFPTPTGEHAEAFADWFANGSECETHIDPVFRDPVRKSLLYAQASRTGSTGAGPSDQQVILPADADLGQGPPQMPEVAMQIYRQRPDLTACFPDPFGLSRKRFAFWYVTHGSSEYALEFPLVWPTVRSLPFWLKARAAMWWFRRYLAVKERQLLVTNDNSGRTNGSHLAASERPRVRKPGSRGVTVVGWTDAPTGVGQACRGSLAALDAAALPYSVETLPHGNQFSRRIARIDYEVLLFHVNADMMPIVKGLAPGSRSARFQIGYWFWELSHFPLDFQTSFLDLNEVWAPSVFCQQAYTSISPIPVRLVPPCVIPPKGEKMDRARWGIRQGTFLFLTTFDTLSIPERKNPSGAIRAFQRLIEAGPPTKAHLLVKVKHAEQTPEVVDRLRVLAANLPITLITASYTRSQMDRLLATCDAYVALHRSEGLGLPLIEAMFCGKPVIGTGYGGCTDFLSEETGWPVAYRLVPIQRPAGPYPVGAVWADPDVDDAARQMLRVLACPAHASARAAAALRLVSELYGPDSAAKRFQSEFERVFSRIERKAGPSIKPIAQLEWAR